MQRGKNPFPLFPLMKSPSSLFSFHRGQVSQRMLHYCCLRRGKMRIIRVVMTTLRGDAIAEVSGDYSLCRSRGNIFFRDWVDGILGMSGGRGGGSKRRNVGGRAGAESRPPHKKHSFLSDRETRIALLIYLLKGLHCYNFAAILVLFLLVRGGKRRVIPLLVASNVR